jgi:uncharacterized membrane protein YbaN (DUF454 family)
MSTYDTSTHTRLITGLTRSRQQANDSHWFTKLLALVILLLFVAIGMVGLLLPIIPGLLFLAIAAIIAARLFPPLGARMRQHRVFAAYMERTDNFWRLTLQGKVKFAFWLTLKLLWDSCVLLVEGLGKLIDWLRKDKPGF